MLPSAVYLSGHFKGDPATTADKQQSEHKSPDTVVLIVPNLLSPRVTLGHASNKNESSFYSCLAIMEVTYCQLIPTSGGRHAPISLDDREKRIIGRSSSTSILDPKCSRQQVSFDLVST